MLLNYKSYQSIRNEDIENMKRSEIREAIFKVLFRVEFHPQEEWLEQVDLFLEEPEYFSGVVEEKDKEYIKKKTEDILIHIQEINEMLSEKSKGWKLERMGKVELSILRLAVYEIHFDEEVPTGVAINEAVELAKKFGGDDSRRFVNGILAKLA